MSEIEDCPYVIAKIADRVTFDLFRNSENVIDMVLRHLRPDQLQSCDLRRCDFMSPTRFYQLVRRIKERDVMRLNYDENNS